MKICARCKKNLSSDSFYVNKNKALSSYCKPCCKTRRKEYYNSNKERENLLSLKYKKENSVKIKEYRRAYYIQNSTKEKQNAKRWRDQNPGYITIYSNKKYKTDIQYKIARNIRNRINSAIKNKKEITTLGLLGCSLQKFKLWIEMHFKEGMNWNNHGKWHMDHIIPLSRFDLTREINIKKACHYTNIQPLWASENISKRNRLPSKEELNTIGA